MSELACVRLLGVVLGLIWAPAGAAVVQWGGSGVPQLMLESELDRAQSYVHAQAVYTLRFYQAIDVRELQLNGPTTSLAELRPIGEPRIDEAKRDGKRYRVTERRYAVFPFASGELVLTGAHVVGLVAVAGGAPGERAPVRLDAPPARLDVVPAPALAGTEAWLPAHALVLTEHWHTDPRAARVGEALVRTVRIEASGVSAAQLPAPDPGGDGYAAHASSARLEDRFDNDLNVGIREQDWRIVPARAGKIEIAELRLPWWDALSGERRIARIPARTLSVGAATMDVPEQAVPAPVAPGAAGVEPQAQAGQLSPARPDAPTEPADPVWWASSWPWTVCVGVLIVVALGWRKAQQPQRRALRALQRACQRNDAQGARNALLAWAALRHHGSAPRTLGELGPRLTDPVTRNAVAALDRHLYGPEGGVWSGRALCAFRDLPLRVD